MKGAFETWFGVQGPGFRVYIPPERPFLARCVATSEGTGRCQDCKEDLALIRGAKPVEINVTSAVRVRLLLLLPAAPA